MREGVLEAAANEAESDEQADDAAEGNIPRCAECGAPLDDIEKMTEKQVLEHMRLDLMRDLLRSIRMGTATHQEKAIMRGILRDNKMGIDPAADPEDDIDEPGGEADMPKRGKTALPLTPSRAFPDYGDTDGG